MATKIKRKKLSPHKFRQIMDDDLGLDALDMARLLGLKLDNRKNAIRVVERYRNGDKPISGTMSSLLAVTLETGATPAWLPKDLRERVSEVAAA